MCNVIKSNKIDKKNKQTFDLITQVGFHQIKNFIGSRTEYILFLFL